MKCFYHSSDLDGHCSGAIVQHFHPHCETIGINYGEDFPWYTISQGETVFMVDFALQPFSGMERLNTLADLIWIDHHKTAIEEAELRGFGCKGIRRIGIGACALTWEYMTKVPAPYAVGLLAEYDVWDHSNPNTLPFQYGLRFEEDTRPDQTALWEKLFDGKSFVVEIVDRGRLLLEYERRQNAKFCAAYSFETTLATYRAIAINKGFTNSKVFDSVWDPEKYDMMVTFCRLPKAQQWAVSMYTDKKEVDVGAIASHFGGGGHKNAAGFQCYKLPFRY